MVNSSSSITIGNDDDDTSSESYVEVSNLPEVPTPPSSVTPTPPSSTTPPPLITASTSAQVPTPPVTPTPIPKITPTPAKKKKRASSPTIDSFEAEMLKRIDSCSETDSCARFGAVVADGLRSIKDEYARELLKNQISELIFKTRFANHPNQSPIPTFSQPFKQPYPQQSYTQQQYTQPNTIPYTQPVTQSYPQPANTSLSETMSEQL